MVEQLRAKIREIPGFPRPGIVFYDLTTLLKDGPAFRSAVDLMVSTFAGSSIDKVVAVESRGFIFGGAIAYLLGAGFVPIRKLGKLPAEVITREYTLEYDSNHLELHRDALQPGDRVLLVDDLLATGGTLRASKQMIEELGAEPVAASVLVELGALKGRERLESDGLSVVSFITY